MQLYLHKFFPFVDFLYILQLEDYNSRGYLKWIESRLLKRTFQKVAHITWTQKAVSLLGLSMLLYIAITIKVSVLIPTWWWEILTLIITTALIPYIILLANVLFSPFDIWAKRNTIAQAIKKLQSFPDLKIIAVVGSQGKTSTRSFITQLLEGSVKYHTPEKNFNVGLSIARDIIHNLKADTRIYVVEFGELYKGDLTYLDAFLHPSIVVLTSIGSQHIAQFGSQNAIDLEFLSLLNSTKAHVFINGDDAGVKRIRPAIKQKYDSYHTFTLDTFHKLEKLPEILRIDHMQQNAAAAAKIAKELGITESDIEKKLSELKPVERRLNIIRQNDITIIDDSYNISPESAQEALEHLKSYHGRKIIVTGGVVDQGNNEARANIEFGSLIANVADIVVIASNNLATHIVQGAESENTHIQILTSPHPQTTPEILQKILKPGDVVLIQNELPDLYWS